MSDGMKKTLIVVILLGAIGAVIAAKQLRAKADQEPQTGPELPPAVVTETKLPRLLELGSDKCIPCKQMKPIIDELTVDYKSSLKVEFIDVWKDEEAGKEYNIDKIPTQIFFDADGNELFRHVGFYPKADILAKWKELGIELAGVK